LITPSATDANEAGVKIAISTDAHSAREFGNVRYGVDQPGAQGSNRLPF
jgi:histidinol phosphatase-like PHP family hydrolase